MISIPSSTITLANPFFQININIIKEWERKTKFFDSSKSYIREKKSEFLATSVEVHNVEQNIKFYSIDLI